MKYIRLFAAPLALSLALVAGGCSSKDNANDTLAADTSLNNDLKLANSDSANPQLNDVAKGTTTTPTATKKTTGGGTGSKTTVASKTPAGNTVTKTPAGSAGVIRSIPSGSTVTLTSNTKVCTNTHKVGDRFTANVAEQVTGSGGATIPQGAQAVVQITSLKRSENSNDNVEMGFRVISISFGGKTYNVDATTQSAQVDKVRNSSKGNDAKKVAIGAAIGAAAGQVLGKDTKSTVIGAAAGAAAGTGAAIATANYEGCVNPGARIVVRLDNAMTVVAD
jgi:hypothetical protein